MHELLLLVSYIERLELEPTSSPVVPASFNVTSPVKLVGRTRLGYRARFQVCSFHLDSGNWPGDEAGLTLRA